MNEVYANRVHENGSTIELEEYVDAVSESSVSAFSCGRSSGDNCRRIRQRREYRLESRWVAFSSKDCGWLRLPVAGAITEIFGCTFSSAFFE